MKIKSILSKKGGEVITIGPQATIHEAIVMMAEHNIGALIVTNALGELTGILSERDIVRKAADYRDITALEVQQVMTKEVLKGEPEDDILAVAHIMTERRFRHLPVRSEGRLIGIVSIGDILKAQRDEYLGAKDTLESQIMAWDD